MFLSLVFSFKQWVVLREPQIQTSAADVMSAALVALAKLIDSLIEIFASPIVVWQLRGAGQTRERQALRLIGIAFFSLALYIAVQSLRALLSRIHPATSPLGIAWLTATVVAMLLLAWGKYHTGRQINNPVLLTESRVTLIDAYLAAAVLVGITTNALLGWWWTDPLAGLVIVYYGFREGLHAYREGKAP